MKVLNPMDIDRYIMQAEENFSGADGDYENYLTGGNLDLNADGGYNGADGYYYGATGDYFYADGTPVAAPAAAMPMPAPVAEVPAKQPTPYMVNVTNPTAGIGQCILFGNNTYLMTLGFGSSPGLIVAPAQANVSYLELLQQSASQPFETSLMRVTSNNVTQLLQNITVTSKDANGQLCQIPIIAQSYFSANQFQSGILDIPYPVKIDGNTYLQIDILPGTINSYTFFPANKINQARLLGGGSDIQRYGSPAVPVAVPMFTSRPIGLGRNPKMIPARNR